MQLNGGILCLMGSQYFLLKATEVIGFLQI
jgi:hypothetical protein